jgi:N-methylhydantoinase A
MTSKAFNAEHASRVLSDLVAEARQSLSTQGYEANLEIYRSLEMRYFGQNHELEVAVEFDSFDEQTILDVWEQFHSVHKTRYNFDIPGETIELISIKVTAVSLTPKPNLLEIERSIGPAISEGTRLVRYDSGHIETPIYSRELLRAGDSFNGPAIIEEGASVTIIRPEYNVKIDLYGNILIGEIAT